MLAFFLFTHRGMRDVEKRDSRAQKSIIDSTFNSHYSSADILRDQMKYLKLYSFPATPTDFLHESCMTRSRYYYHNYVNTFSGTIHL